MYKYIEQAIEMVMDVQRIYGQCAKTGEFKKARVKEFFENQLVKLAITECYEEHEILKDFIDHYLDPLIDSIVWIARNKQITKMFKKSCSCAPFKVPF